METVTQASLLDAIRQALEAPGPDDALTTYEIGKRFGRSQDWAQGKIRELLERGEVERAVVRREDIKGVLQPVPAYRLKLL